MPNIAVDLKIREYRLPTVRVIGPDEASVIERLSMMIDQRPALFKGMDVAMDYTAELPDEFDRDVVEDFLSQHGVRVVARTTGEGKGLGFNDKAGSGAATDADVVIEKSLRSGQRIYSKGAVVILGSVSSGAEVLSEGSIHIYGELRGRALAGVQGNRDAAIYTQSLDAELVSIAGTYRTGDQLEDEGKGSPCRVLLDGDTLSFQPITD